MTASDATAAKASAAAVAPTKVVAATEGTPIEVAGREAFIAWLLIARLLEAALLLHSRCFVAARGCR